MKKKLFVLLGRIFLTTPLLATAQYQSGDFYYDSDGSVITITGYTGGGGDVTIPRYLYDDAIGTLRPVQHIGDSVFHHQTNLTSVTIPDGVTSIGGSIGSTFEFCTSLRKVTIGNGLISLGQYSFASCTSLTNITMPGSTAHIGYVAFQNCTSLTAVFFKGNAPSSDGNAFDRATNATVYYLPGTTGWNVEFNGAPTRLWNPLMQSSGVRPAGFGFNITGTTNIPIVVEAATNLASASWVPLQSLNLTNGAFYFSDPNWTDYSTRTYHIRSP